MKNRQHSPKKLLCALVFFLTTASLLSRDKTDIIILKNGDKLTCEIKSLERGRLSASTSYMGTVSIEWDEVQSVRSIYDFDIETQAGTRYFGSIEEPEGEEKIRVRLDQTSVPLTRDSVIRIRPIEDDFWERLEGRVDFGFNFQKSNSNTVWNLGAEVGRRTRKRQATVTLSSQLASQDEVDTTTRHVVGFTFDQFLDNRWFGSGFFQGTQNSELGIDLRTSYGAAIGRYFIQTNEALISWNGGLVITRERFDDPGAEGSTSLEGLASMRLDFFRFDSPEVDLSTSLLVYPSLSDIGRIRIDFDTRLSWEIFNDFSWTFTFYDNYDSRPPTDDLIRNDFGITTGVGWSF